MTEETKKIRLTEIALAVALLIGSFSLFSITFGLNQNDKLSFYTNNEDQKIYQSQPQGDSLVQTFTFVNPYEQTQEEHQKKYVLQRLQKLGQINARAFVVGDLDTGEIIFERKPNEQFPIASVTKYMTAYTAAEILEPNELATITRNKLKVEGNRARFRVGDKLTIRNLIYPLLLVSSNDAGEIIARQRNRNGFIATMKDLAIEIGMDNTSFQDPTGLSRNNYSTARDLFKMMRAVRKKYPQIIDISRLTFKEHNSYLWRNINKASRFSEFRGGKTGYTNAARQTSIGYYQIKLANDQTKNIAIVILQSNTRQQDTRNILDYLKLHVAYL